VPDYQILAADFRATLAAARGQAALIATSPPYPSGARTCYGQLEWQDYQDLGDAVKNALLPGGHCLLNLSAPVRQMREGHGTERDPMPFRVLLDWIDRVGLTCPDVLAFGRMGVPGVFPGFRQDWEPLLWFRRPGAALPIHQKRLKVKVRPYGTATSARNAGGKLVKAKRKIQDERLPGTLWNYGPIGGNKSGDLPLEDQNHPASWPYKLAADIVACFSDVGDLVIDPFLGGGTTLCAACDGTRRFLGGDLSAEWALKSAELAKVRYSQGSLFPAPGNAPARHAQPSCPD